MSRGADGVRWEDGYRLGVHRSRSQNGAAALIDGLLAAIFCIIHCRVRTIVQYGVTCAPKETFQSSFNMVVLLRVCSFCIVMCLFLLPDVWVSLHIRCGGCYCQILYANTFDTHPFDTPIIASSSFAIALKFPS